ncbi:hypothetical protein A0J61_11522, partial [Choanephora cucurbitarum]
MFISQNSKSKRDQGSESSKGKQPIEGLRTTVSEKNVPDHLSTI